jgi:hypothetical protein
MGVGGGQQNDKHTLTQLLNLPTCFYFLTNVQNGIKICGMEDGWMVTTKACAHVDNSSSTVLRNSRASGFMSFKLNSMYLNIFTNHSHESAAINLLLSFSS